MLRVLPSLQEEDRSYQVRRPHQALPSEQHIGKLESPSRIGTIWNQFESGERIRSTATHRTAKDWHKSFRVRICRVEREYRFWPDVRPIAQPKHRRTALCILSAMRAHLRTFASELGISLASVEARGLPLCEEASELELVEVGEDGKEHFLVPAAANAWRSLQGAAIADDIQLFIVSAFRSVERQAELVRRKLAVGMPIDDVLSVCAPPGFSEHHTGRAVDLSTPGVSVLEAEFDQTVAFAWLTRRAKDFGFHLSFPAGNSQGYLYEPWHWCFHDVHAGGPPP